MSLINQMLNDLDQQRAAQPPAAKDLPSGVTSGRVFKHWRLLIGGLVLMLGLVGAVAALVLRTPAEQGTLVITKNSQVKNTAELPPVTFSAHTADRLETAAATFQPADNAQYLVKRIELPPKEKFRRQKRPVSSNPIKADSAVPTSTSLAATIIPSKTLSADLETLPENQTKLQNLKQASLQPVIIENDVAVSRETNPRSDVVRARSDKTVLDRTQPVSATITENVKQPVKDPELSPGQRALNQSQGYVQQGRLAEAETELRKANELMPKNTNAQVQLAGLLMRGGRNSEALEFVQSGLELSPRHPKLNLLKARLLAEAGKTAQATLLLEQTLPKGTAAKNHLNLLATLQQQQGQYRKAQAGYRRLLALDPHTAGAWAGLAISSDVLGEVDVALKAYQQALTMQPLALAVRNYARERIAALENKRNVDGSDQ